MAINEEYYKSIGGVLESNDYTEQSNLFNVSWALHEGYKDISEKLDDLIPLEGAVPQGRSVNKCLEKFRVAQNLIYDLFNNGLCNRRSHFKQFFGWAPYTRNCISQNEFNYYEIELEPVFTKIIIDAYKEQKNLGNIE